MLWANGCLCAAAGVRYTGHRRSHDCAKDATALQHKLSRCPCQMELQSLRRAPGFLPILVQTLQSTHAAIGPCADVHHYTIESLDPSVSTTAEAPGSEPLRNGALGSPACCLRWRPASSATFRGGEASGLRLARATGRTVTALLGRGSGSASVTCESDMQWVWWLSQSACAVCGTVPGCIHPHRPAELPVSCRCHSLSDVSSQSSPVSDFSLRLGLHLHSAVSGCDWADSVFQAPRLSHSHRQ